METTEDRKSGALISADEIAQTRAGWQAAESRLYPLAMIDASAYARGVLIVAALRESLRASVSTVEMLVACERDAAPLVVAATTAAGVSRVGLVVGDLFGSAAAALDRQISADLVRRGRLASLDGARLAGSQWLDLFVESLGPLIPQLRVHVETGRATFTAIGMDHETGAPVLQLRRVRVDLDTGEFVLGETEDEPFEVSTADEWAVVVASIELDQSR